MEVLFQSLWLQLQGITSMRLITTWFRALLSCGALSFPFFHSPVCWQSNHGGRSEVFLRWQGTMVATSGVYSSGSRFASVGPLANFRYEPTPCRVQEKSSRQCMPHWTCPPASDKISFCNRFVTNTWKCSQFGSFVLFNNKTPPDFHCAITDMRAMALSRRNTN